MNSNKKIAKIDTKAILSTLWIFVLLNIIFRDIHEIVTPEFIEKTVNSVQPTEGLFLAAAIMLEIPLKIEKMEEAILETLRRNNIRDGYIRAVVTRGKGDLGVDPGKTNWLKPGECGRRV